MIEEIKSVVLAPLMFAALDARSHPHYVEQLRLYCFLAMEGSALWAASHGRRGWARALQTSGCARRLVYVNATDGARKDIEIPGPFDDCEALIADRVRILIGRAYEEQRQHVSRRQRSTELRFPHDKPRKHQDRMIAAVEKALAEGRHLMITAPSGIGKTAGALYPTVKFALANDMRLFFTTSKNTQQAIALETLRKMGGCDGVETVNQSGGTTADASRSTFYAPTAVSFRAREQMCTNDAYACHEEFCPYLRDFAAKLELTRVVDKLLAQRLVLPEAMVEAGRQARLCPFELALLEAERTDVIVCDYNYVFDPQVYFRRFFQDEDYSNAILIVDEAHNLLQRALDYYSPVLRRGRYKT